MYCIAALSFDLKLNFLSLIVYIGPRSSELSLPLGLPVAADFTRLERPESTGRADGGSGRGGGCRQQLLPETAHARRQLDRRRFQQAYGIQGHRTPDGRGIRQDIGR
jgi:hypothetical protein